MSLELTEVQVYIGESIYWKLPEKEQETFEVVERYKPDALAEQIMEAQENDESWKDPFGPFIDIQDYEDFWGGDVSEVGGRVYGKYFSEEDGFLSNEDEKRFKELSTEIEKDGDGNQLRILRMEKASWVTEYNPTQGIKIDSYYIKEGGFNEGVVFSIKAGKKGIRLVNWEFAGLEHEPYKSLNDEEGELTYECYADANGEYFVDKQYLEPMSAREGQEYEIQVGRKGFRLLPCEDEE